MEEKEYKSELNSLLILLDSFKNKLDFDNKNREINELDSIIKSEGFWNRKDANNVLSRISSLRKSLELFTSTYNKVKDNLELLKLSIEGESLDFINEELEIIKENIEKIKLEVLLSGEFDRNNAIMEIHSGAGGTESNDWANMIKRMYLRYFERNNYKVEVISEQEGEEVGIKGVTLRICGVNVFGLLKGETGVHRLVRISPFDANKRRHTSFASVLVTPEIDTNIDIQVREEDLKIDVFRSSGAGGQSVNTTDSAVRITHLPTKIVVTVQNERSQIKNKEKAMNILKSKLYLLEKENLDKKLSDLKGNIMDVNFGSQIRNYVMCPYNLVKDLRTNYETSDVDGVLDGKIESFIESYLKC